jgi:hypothetical protein
VPGRIILTQSRKDTKSEGWKMNENEIGAIVVDCAVKLHQELGPGLLESVYEAVLAKRLEQRGLSC